MDKDQPKTVLVSLTKVEMFITHLDVAKQTLLQGREEGVVFHPASLLSIQAIAVGLEAEESSLLTVTLATTPRTTLTTGTR